MFCINFSPVFLPLPTVIPLKHTHPQKTITWSFISFSRLPFLSYACRFISHTDIQLFYRLYSAFYLFNHRVLRFNVCVRFHSHVVIAVWQLIINGYAMLCCYFAIHFLPCMVAPELFLLAVSPVCICLSTWITDRLNVRVLLCYDSRTFIVYLGNSKIQ